jgi:hypothetical protein
MLRVALGYGKGSRIDGNQLSCGQLRAATTLGADVEDDLVAGTALVARTPEHRPCEGEQQSVVIQACVAGASQLGRRFAKRRVRVGADLEAQHVPARSGLGWGVRRVSRAHSDNQRLHLPGAFAASGLEPLVFRLCRDDPRELAQRRPVVRTGLQRLRQQR